ncbi:MAG: protein-L-isoaspartate O-methyltransferase family protein [Candidatus Methylopumilus sp.]
MNVKQESPRAEQSRFNMIEQQIRPWDVLDGAVLDLLAKLPREAFVPKQYIGLAFADLEIPLGDGQVMLSPKMEGRILQSLAIKKTDKVLEIGTGSGYLTALLALQAKHVDSVELHAKLSKQAAKNIAAQGIANVNLVVADGVKGLPANAPYDVIVYTASIPMLNTQVERQLAIGGRMFVVVGEAPAMEATLITRISADSFKTDVLFETCLPMLVNAPQAERFEF